MSDHDCLARLERELKLRAPHGNDTLTMIDLMAALYAAQSVAPILQTQGVDDAWTRLTRAEYDRLRASDKWAREIAAPTLELYASLPQPVNAQEALSSRPKDAT
jgi:hypothetical protein